MSSFFIYDTAATFATTLTTFIVLTILCGLFKFKKGVSAGLFVIIVLILGYIVKRISMHFTMGLDRIGWKLQHLMGTLYDIVVAIVVFVVAAVILSILSKLFNRKS